MAKYSLASEVVIHIMLFVTALAFVVLGQHRQKDGNNHSLSRFF